MVHQPVISIKHHTALLALSLNQSDIVIESVHRGIIVFSKFIASFQSKLYPLLIIQVTDVGLHTPVQLLVHTESL